MLDSDEILGDFSYCSRYIGYLNDSTTVKIDYKQELQRIDFQTNQKSSGEVYGRTYEFRTVETANYQYINNSEKELPVEILVKSEDNFYHTD